MDEDQHSGLVENVESRLPRWAPAAALVLFSLGIALDWYPGLVSPFAVSTRRDGALGRRRAHVSAMSGEDESPALRSVRIPWSKWQVTSLHGAHAFAGSGVDRHLFGQGGGSARVGGEAWSEDRSSVARVMILKLPRSGSTWFTELLNSCPSVFSSKEIIQAEFDVEFGPQDRLRHLKRSLVWPTGKMSTGPWGGRFDTDYWSAGKWRLPRRGGGVFGVGALGGLLGGGGVDGEGSSRGTNLDVIGFTVNPVKVGAAASLCCARSSPPQQLKCTHARTHTCMHPGHISTPPPAPSVA